MTAEEMLKKHTGEVINGELRMDVLIAMIQFAKIKCKEQRELCRDEFTPDHPNMNRIRLVIENSPEPEFD